MIAPAATRIMRALLIVHARDGRATVRSVAEEADRTIATTHRHLRSLSRASLIAGIDDGTMGALRPLMGIVPIRRNS